MKQMKETPFFSGQRFEKLRFVWECGGGVRGGGGGGGGGGVRGGGGKGGQKVMERSGRPFEEETFHFGLGSGDNHDVYFSLTFCPGTGRAGRSKRRSRRQKPSKIVVRVLRNPIVPLPGLIPCFSLKIK